MINDIFMEYLTGSYPPLTYGEESSLRGPDDGLAVRFALVMDQGRQASGWVDGTMVEPPSFYGVVPGSSWTISAEKPRCPIVYAANDNTVLDVMINAIKFVISSMRCGDILQMTPESTEIVRFKFSWP